MRTHTHSLAHSLSLTHSLLNLGRASLLVFNIKKHLFIQTRSLFTPEVNSARTEGDVDSRRAQTNQ